MLTKKLLLIVIITMLLIGLMYKVYYYGDKGSKHEQRSQQTSQSEKPSPILQSSSPDSNSTMCSTDSDCTAGESCRQTGPMIVDPDTKKVISEKTCIGTDALTPF
jgi:hypothetical protein